MSELPVFDPNLAAEMKASHDTEKGALAEGIHALDLGEGDTTIADTVLEPREQSDFPQAHTELSSATDTTAEGVAEPSETPVDYSRPPARSAGTDPGQPVGSEHDKTAPDGVWRGHAGTDPGRYLGDEQD